MGYFASLGSIKTSWLHFAPNGYKGQFVSPLSLEANDDEKWKDALQVTIILEHTIVSTLLAYCHDQSMIQIFLLKVNTRC